MSKLLRSRRGLVAAAVLVVAAFTAGIAAAGGGDVFTDVGDTHPFEEEIEEFAEAGITAGYPDGTYRGGDPVTRQAMAAFMVRGLPRLGYATSTSTFTVGTVPITLNTVNYDVPGEPGGVQRVVVDATTSWQVNADTKADACNNSSTQECEFQVGIYLDGDLVHETTGRVTSGNDGGTISVHAIIPNAPTGTTLPITFVAEPGLNLQSADLQLTERQMTVVNIPFFDV